MGAVTGTANEHLRPPERLNHFHMTAEFTSQEPSLDAWLKQRALASEGRTARTYVVCAGSRVVGYYALANGAVQRAGATSRLRRNAPDPIPVMVLCRLAVDRAWEGQGIGRGMLRDAILRTRQAGEIAGIGASLVHAISDRAKGFYLANGFGASDLEPMTLMIPLRDVG